ncbi:MAG TPA: asparagine synthase-related protein [Thermoanaerobaculia bacterium]|nr:asparagine synthase-related protein [Thermoanaerobaculia bacterium]
MSQPVARVVDLTDPALTSLVRVSLDDARARVARGDADGVAALEGSYALVGVDGIAVRLARSLDRPLRYFLAKEADGPVLVVADRIDAIARWLSANGHADQFHPSYTRMVPAHHLATVRLVGCPDPEPSYVRTFTPTRNALPADLDAIGRLYVSALADEIAGWIDRAPADEPLGVCFSGGIDSGAVFLVTQHVLRRLGMSPARLKAFTLTLGEGPDLAQARAFLEAVDMGLFLESVEADAASLDPFEAVRVIEDYKPLDVESATMALALLGGIRARYPDWKLLLDGDGGDENLKDYPIEENPELTIRSVVNNLLLYQEGWGVGSLKHSQTYTGGQSRSYARTYAPLRKFGFSGFSPFTRPRVVAVAEGIPFADLTRGRVERLYALKGEIVARGVKAVTGLSMPVFPKRRFQQGAGGAALHAQRFPYGEARYRQVLVEAYPGAA